MSAYLKDYTKDYYGDDQLSCRIMIEHNFFPQKNQVVLGTVYLEEYLTAYDFDNNMVGVDGYIDELPLTITEAPLWAIIVLASIALIAVVVTITLFVKSHLRKSQKVTISSQKIKRLDKKPSMIDNNCINQNCEDTIDNQSLVHISGTRD
jgi:hypothetical protein